MEKWESMPQELQDTANQAMEDVYFEVTAAAAERDQEARAAAEEYGVVWTEVSEENMQSFYEAGNQVLEDLAARYPDAAPGFEIIKEWHANKNSAAN